jgi:hypothetical protein
LLLPKHSPLEEQAEHSRLRSAAKAINTKHLAHRSASELGDALVATLEEQIRHLQKASAARDQQSPKFIHMLEQGIHVIDGAAPAISRANRKLLREIRNTENQGRKT